MAIKRQVVLICAPLWVNPENTMREIHFESKTNQIQKARHFCDFTYIKQNLQRQKIVLRLPGSWKEGKEVSLMSTWFVNGKMEPSCKLTRLVIALLSLHFSPQNYVHKMVLVVAYLKHRMHFTKGKSTQNEGFFVLFVPRTLHCGGTKRKCLTCSFFNDWVSFKSNAMSI